MSLPNHPIEPVPEETVRIAQAAFPKGNIYMKIAMSWARYMRIHNLKIYSLGAASPPRIPGG